MGCPRWSNNLPESTWHKYLQPFVFSKQKQSDVSNHIYDLCILSRFALSKTSLIRKTPFLRLHLDTTFFNFLQISSDFFRLLQTPFRGAKIFDNKALITSLYYFNLDKQQTNPNRHQHHHH